MSNMFGKPNDTDDENFFDLFIPEDGSSSKLIPKGEYPAECIDAKGTTSKKGDPMLVLTWAVTKGEYAGREIPMFITKTPSNAWKLTETLNTLKLTDRIVEREDKHPTINLDLFRKIKAKISVGTFKGDRGEMNTVDKCIAV